MRLFCHAARASPCNPEKEMTLDVRSCGNFLRPRQYRRAGDAAEQYWFKIGVWRAILIQRTGRRDSIIAKAIVVGDFIDSIDPKRTTPLLCNRVGWLAQFAHRLLDNDCSSLKSQCRHRARNNQVGPACSCSKYAESSQEHCQIPDHVIAGADPSRAHVRVALAICPQQRE